MEKMIKLNKSKIAELIAKKHLTVKMVADGACLAYTTAKHIIQEGKDCVEATSVDKVERLAKALGATVKAITIGKPYDRYPKKAAPVKTTAKKATTKKAPKKIPLEKMGAIKIKTVGTAIVAEPMEIPEAKLPEHIHTDSSVMDKLAELQERIAKLEKIVLKTSSRKKLVKVE